MCRFIRMCIFLPTSPVGFVCGVFTCAGALLCLFWFWLCFFFIPWWPCYWLQSSLFCSVAASARLGGHFCRHACVSLHTKLCLLVVCVCLLCGPMCVPVSLWISTLIYVHACFFLFACGEFYYQCLPCLSLVWGWWWPWLLGCFAVPLAFDFLIRFVPYLLWKFFFTLIDCVTFRGLASLVTFVNCLAALLCHL